MRNAPIVTARARTSRLPSRSSVSGTELFVVAETSAIDFAGRGVGARHRADEYASSRPLATARSSAGHAGDQKPPRASFKPRQDARHQLRRGDRQQIVGIDGHAKKEVIIAEMPGAGEVQLGVSGDQKHHAERDAPGQSATRRPGGRARRHLRGNRSSGHGMGARPCAVTGAADNRNTFQQFVVHAAAGKRLGLAVRGHEYRGRLIHVALPAERAVAFDGGINIIDVLRLIRLKFLELRGGKRSLAITSSILPLPDHSSW